MEGYQTPQGGPMVLGSKPGVAAGTYTDIVGIYGPSEAAEGERVDMRVDIKNKHTYSFWIASLARVDGVDLTPTPEYAAVEPGVIQSFHYAFIMGGKDAAFKAWSYFWTGTEWQLDDERSVTIKLKAPPKAEFRAFGVREYEKV